MDPHEPDSTEDADVDAQIARGLELQRKLPGYAERHHGRNQDREDSAVDWASVGDITDVFGPVGWFLGMVGGLIGWVADRLRRSSGGPPNQDPG